MANKNKAKGTRAETAVVKFGESYGYGLRRKALTGNKDEGDVEFFDAPHLDHPITIEVKAGKQTSNPSRSQIEEWLRQAREEAKNSGQECVLCIVRYNRKIKDADVYLQWDEDEWYPHRVVEHMWLDEFFETFR